MVYDLDTGDPLWVGDGKTADSVGLFLAELSAECAAGIQAVAMDFGPAYQAAVKTQLPEALIVFGRFHVLKRYRDVIRTVHKAAFKKADADGKEVSSLYLLLGNPQRLEESGKARLDTRMHANQTLSTVYTLKEQLQTLWSAPGEAAMRQALAQ
jgi:transposase